MSFSIVITEKGGKPRTDVFDQSEITVGRVQGNDIVLAKGNISKRHSRIVLRDGKFIIVDLKSTNGTFVNGKRISSPQVLKDADKVYIGDYTLQLDPGAREKAASEKPSSKPNGSEGDEPLWGPESGAAPAAAPAPPRSPTPSPRPFPREAAAEPRPEPRAEPRPEPRPDSRPEPRAAEPRPDLQRADSRRSRGVERRPDFSVELPNAQALQVRQAVFQSVSRALGADTALPPDDEATLEKTRQAAEKTLAALQKKLAGADATGWADQIAKELCGFGPLTALLDDPAVVEVYVNGPYQVLVRRAPDSSSVGIPLNPATVYFSSDEAVALVVRRVMHQAGVKFDVEHPVAEARMADGTRVNAVHHTVAVRGPIVTISRSSTRNTTLAELAHESVLSRNMAEFLELCVRSRRNICVCGGPGAGTGTLLSALAAAVPHDERIVVVEQVAKLRLPQPHVVTLEPRPLRGGPSPTTMRDLVANAVRMRPGRLIVHEVTGPEALELSLAMAGRQDGTLFTTYASTARDCLDRIETMVRMAGLDVQNRVVREQLAASVDIIVAMTRFADGSTRVTQIAEVTGVEVDLVTTQDIFTFKRESVDDQGAVVGRFLATGSAPRFYEGLQRRGDSVNLGIFRD